MPSLQIEESITEALENDNLQLQNMSGGKYVQVKEQSQAALFLHEMNRLLKPWSA